MGSFLATCAATVGRNLSNADQVPSWAPKLSIMVRIWEATMKWSALCEPGMGLDEVTLVGGVLGECDSCDLPKEVGVEGVVEGADSGSDIGDKGVTSTLTPAPRFFKGPIASERTTWSMEWLSDCSSTIWTEGIVKWQGAYASWIWFHCRMVKLRYLDMSVPYLHSTRTLQNVMVGTDDDGPMLLAPKR
jgi:hypothetical protein